MASRSRPAPQALTPATRAPSIATRALVACTPSIATGAPAARTPSIATGALRALIALAIATAPAAASPLSDALTRHGDADIAALRPRAAEPAARCTLGAIHARRGDLPRAALYLAGCDDADLPGDIAAAVRGAMRDVKRAGKIPPGCSDASKRCTVEYRRMHQNAAPVSVADMVHT